MQQLFSDTAKGLIGYAGLYLRVEAPHRVEQLLARVGLLRLLQHIAEQPQFGLRQPYRHSSAKDGVFRGGIADVTIAQLAVCRCDLPMIHLYTSQQCLDLHEQDRGAKGLGEIVVTALADSHDIVQLAVLCCEQDNGNVGNSAQLSAHCKSIRAGHHDVQNHQFRRLLPKRLQQRISAFKGAHGVSIACKKAMQQLSYAFFIISQIDGMPHSVLLASSAKCCAQAQHRRSI